ncbi:hypothetical protein ACOZ4I_06495 [Haloarcula salina]|uniref:hypothetical protein n=1 Tax=Haloarcula salina TaxID=1429914 RepID=UPI003C6EC3E2
MTDTNPDIDLHRLYELIDDYQSTSNREKQRQIENQVLEETVWKVPETDEKYYLTEREANILQKGIVINDPEVRRILRKVFIRNMNKS